MTRVLIIYGTTDGQTAKVARFLAKELLDCGAAADVYDSAEANPDPSGYTGVIVAASIQAGGFQRSLVRWVRKHAARLRGKATVFVSVSLSMLQQESKVQQDLRAIHQRFFARTGWTPPWLKPVAGALRYTRYGWLKRLVIRNIARKAGGDTDVSRDFEYTDWEDLRRFTSAFAATCRTLRRHEEAA